MKFAVSSFGIIISHETTCRAEALENENLAIFDFNTTEKERIGVICLVSQIATMFSVCSAIIVKEQRKFRKSTLDPFSFVVCE